MKTTGISRNIRYLLGALLLCCALICGTALAEEYPESAHPYGNGINQTWTYTHPTDVEYLDVTFSSDTDFENGYDNLYVTDGQGTQTIYTGTELAGVTIRLYGNSFTLRLTTDGSVQRYGFRIINIVDPTFTIENGVLTKYNGPGGVVTVPDGVTSIGRQAFLDCVELTEVILPDTVTSIDYQAFYNCSNLTEIDWSANLKTIGQAAFRGCGMTSMVLPDSLTSLGTEAFSYCTKLQTVELPSRLTTIDYGAFYNCSRLTEIVMPDTVTTLGNYIFNGCTSLTTVHLSNGLTALGNGVFYGCTKLASVDFPTNLTSIGSQTFYNCYALTSITIPDTVTSIGTYAFYYCYQLKEIDWPENLRTISDYAFYQCHGLYPIILPDLITSIGTNAFQPNTIYCRRNTSTAAALDLTTYSYEFISSPYTYRYNEDGGAIITGYIGDACVLAIPSSIDDLKVTAIGSYAFSGCDGLMEVIVPDTVTSIGDYAFQNCPALTTVNLPVGLETIGSYAFHQCHALSSITMPDTVTQIGDYAFSSCYNLTSVDLSANLETIGSNAFQYCHGLTEIVLPDTVTQIGDYAFFYCSNLTSVDLSASLETIGSNAFNYCYSLTEIVLPDTVTQIGDYAFYNCYNLTGIDLPERLETIGGYAFQNCESLTEIVLPDTVTSIGDYAFAYCYNLTSITLSENLEQIGNYAFYECDGLNTIVLPDTVTMIGDYAFASCDYLTNITLPENLETVGSYAFDGCYALNPLILPDQITAIGTNAFCYSTIICCQPNTTTAETLATAGYSYSIFDSASGYTYTENGDGTAVITGYIGSDTVLEIPSEINGLTVTAIGSNAFYGYDHLTEVNVPATVTTIGDSAFYFCEGLTKVELPESLEVIENYAFQYCTSLTAIDLPDQITVLNEGTFGLCSSLTTVELPEGLQEIGRIAFNSCTSLTEINLPSSVTYIDDQAFQYCSSLTSIELPEGLQEIGSSAFSNCTSLTEIAVPGTVARIGDYAFQYCTSLTDVELSSGLQEIGNGAFQRCTSLTEIAVPGTVARIGDDAFYYCINLTNVELPAGVQEIGSYAFYNCTSLTEIAVPGTVTRIGDSAFYYCSNLTTVELSAGLQEIGSNAFYRCTSLRGIAVPDTVTRIDDQAFYNCISLAKVELPAGLQEIGSNTFSNCTSLTEIAVPDTVEWIGNNAFSNCTKLTRVELSEGLQGIDNYAFSNCPSLTEIDLPDSITYIGEWAFNNCTGLTEVRLPANLTDISYGLFRYCTGLTRVVLPESTAYIADSAFEGCANLVNINLPGNISEIGYSAFSNCPNVVAYVEEGSYAHQWCMDNYVEYRLSAFDYINNGDGTCTITGYVGAETDVVIPETVDGLNVRSIGEAAFANDEAITSVVIPEGVTRIGEAAFRQCASLQSVTLPGTLQIIEDNVFSFCTSLPAMTIPASVTEIGVAFYGMPTILTVEEGNTAYKVEDDVLYTADGKTLMYCPAGKSGVFAIPEGTERVAPLAFYGNGAYYSNGGYLTEVQIPASVTEIGTEAFSSMSYVERIEVDEANTAYKDVEGMLLTKDGTVLINVPMAFAGSTLVVPDGVQTVLQMAFQGSNGSSVITGLVLPDSLTTIEDYGFAAFNLGRVAIPASVSSMGENAFYNLGRNFSVMVHQNTAAKQWSDAHEIRQLVYADNGNGTCTIVDYAMGETNVVVPESIRGMTVTAIGESAFADQWQMESIVLPEGLESIGALAFDYCESLTSIHLPASVSYVDGAAFQEYCGAQEITVDENNPTYTDVDGILFTKDLLTLVRYPSARPGTAYTVPAGVENIHAYAFQGCRQLEEIYLLSGVKTIGDYAFDTCVSLRYIALPESIETIGVGALDNCGNVIAGVVEGSKAHEWCLENNINWGPMNYISGEFRYGDYGDGTCIITGYYGTADHVEIPAEINGLKVSAIGELAFDMAPMSSVTLPEGLERIEALAFSFCENLTSIHVPASVTYVDSRAFSPYSGVTNITVDENSQTYTDIGGVLFTKDGQTLVRYPSARSDSSYTVPDGVKVIGETSMHLSYALEEIILPESIRRIEENGFSYCVSLRHINLPQGISYIADSAMDNVGNVCAEVVYGSYAYFWCREHDIRVLATEAPVESDFLYVSNGDGTITIIGYIGSELDLVIPTELAGMPAVAIGDYAFEGLPITSVTVPEGIVHIGDYAFSMCEDLKTVYLPASLNEINITAYAVYSGICDLVVADDNPVMTAIDGVLYSKDRKTLLFYPSGRTQTAYTVPDGTETIGQEAFYGCQFIETVVLPDSVTVIEDSAFGWCPMLRRINLPADMTYIADNAFESVGNLIAVVIEGSYAHDWCVRNDVDVWIDQKGEYIYIDNGDGTATITGYVGVSDTMEIPAEIDGLTVTIIAPYAFEGLDVTSVILPEGLLSIGECAFAYCEGITEVHLPASVVDVEPTAFAIYSNIQNITVADGNLLLSSVDGVLFSKDKSTLLYYPSARTESVYTVPNGTTVISKGAFYGCHSLEELILPEGILTLEDEMLYWCPLLTAINLPESIEFIGEHAMESTGNLTATVVYPGYEYDWCVENGVKTFATYPYTYEDNGDGTVTITGYTGTDTEIVIPGNINGKRVTKIGASAFAFNTTLTSVTMQRGLFEIGFDAFQSCTSLAQVNLPDGLSFIDDYAFGNCTALETITLPSSVQRVSAKTFFGCTGMQEFAANGPWFFAMDGVLYERQNPVLVAYPAGREGHYTVVEGTQEIQDQAFGRAEKLTSLTIPDGVTKLYTSTFEDCSALEWIDLPATLTEIEDHTFAMCSSLKEIILPNDITIIGEEVFAPETVIYCQENTTTAQTLAAAGYSYQAIPFTYTDNGDGTATIMQYTGTAAKVKVPAMIDGLRVTSIGGFVAIENETLESVILPEGIETIKHMAFASTRALKSISLPESLIEIQGSAFVDSTALESIFLPKNVQNVGRAFYNCPSLTSFEVDSENAWFKAEDGVLFDKAGTTIIFYPGGKEGSYEVPYGVTTIAVESFACAEKLTSVVIPGTVEVIGELAFEGCLSLKDISLSEGLLYIDRGAFHYCSALESIYLPSTVEIAPEGVFLNCGRMTAYEVAEGNATLSAVDGVLFSKDGTTLYAFPGAKAGHYDVPAGVTTIHNNAFSKAEYLTSLSIPNGVTQIFLGRCTSLEQIDLPATLTTIPSGAFYSCTSLKEIVLPNNITSVGYSAFIPEQTLYCSEGSVTAQTLTAAGYSYQVFPFTYTDNGDGTATITGYTGTDAEVVIPESINGLKVTVIGPSAFKGNTTITHVTIPEGVTQFKDCVFWNCTNLTEVILPDTVTELGNATFWNTALTSIDLPDGLTKIGWNVFMECPGLTEITLPDQVQKIDNAAFFGCDNLTTVHFPADLETIICNAFQNCPSLTSIVLPEKVRLIDSDAFNGCTSLSSVVLPDSLQEIRANAFKGCTSLTEIILPDNITIIGQNAFAAETTVFCHANTVTEQTLKDAGMEYEIISLIDLVPVSQLTLDPIPYGMVAETTVTDGSVHVFFDDEATNWNRVFTFLEPERWQYPEPNDPMHGSAYVGIKFAKPEGTAYCKTLSLSYEMQDEEILEQFKLEQEHPLNEMSSHVGRRGRVASCDWSSGTILIDNAMDYYFIQWLDADLNVISTEKVVIEITFVNPDKTYTFSRMLVPEASILANTDSAAGVEYTAEDGGLTVTVDSRETVVRTKILAPEEAVAYSMLDENFDGTAERWTIENGAVDFELNGWPTEEDHFSLENLLCWYDADGNLIGGGWITFTYLYEEKLPQMVLPAFMKEIQEEAFAGSGVQCVIIPDGCTMIGARAFANCEALREIHIPMSVSIIAEDAFAGCEDLTIYAPAGSEAFECAQTNGFDWRAE